MGAKYVSGSMRGAGSVEESRLFSFTRSSICCSPAPTLFTDSCHYLRLIRFYPICRSTLFTETRTTQALNKEVPQRGLSVGACGFRFSIGQNKYENDLFLCNKPKRMIPICFCEGKWQCTDSETGTNTHLCAYTDTLATYNNLNNLSILILVAILNIKDTLWISHCLVTVSIIQESKTEASQ